MHVPQQKLHESITQKTYVLTILHGQDQTSRLTIPFIVVL